MINKNKISLVSPAILSLMLVMICFVFSFSLSSADGGNEQDGCPNSACEYLSEPSSGEAVYSLVRIEIPAISVDCSIEKAEYSEEQHTWDISSRTKAFYWLEGTPHPEMGGNTVLAAHYLEYGLSGPLNDVRKLKEGDEIILYSLERKYVYRMEKYQYVPNDFVEPMNYRPYAVTLSTCANFNWDTGTWDARTIVSGKLDHIEKI